MRALTIVTACVAAFLAALGAADVKRPRLAEEAPPGVREKLSLGTLFLPKGLPATGTVPLFLHFHGPGWVAEVAAARGGLAVIHAQLGSGSAVYGKPFSDPKRLNELLAEAQKKAGRELELVGLTGWSAGYGAVRAILRVEDYYQRVEWVVLMDGLHAGYTDAKKPKEADLDCYLKLVKDAAANRKTFLVTHSRIVPGSYASTTEAADALIAHAGLKRHKAETLPGAADAGLPVELCAQAGGLTVLGCKGAAAADHVDHLHALPRLVRMAATGDADARVADDVPLLHTAQLVPVPAEDGTTAQRQIDALLRRLGRELQGRGRSGLNEVVRLNVYAASDDVVSLVRRAMPRHFRGLRKPALSVAVGAPVADGVHVSLDAVATTRLSARERGVLPAGPVYYVSGQAERGKTLAEATRKTLASLDATLTSLGRTRDDVVQVRAFVHPMKQIADVRKEVVAHYTDRPPATFVEWTVKDSVEIELIVAGEAAAKKAASAVDYLTPKGMKASPIFSRVALINHGQRLYTSGLTGAGEGGAAQVKDVFARLGAILKEHGGDFKHLAKATYYVSTDDASKQLNALRPSYYDPKRPPAASKAPVRGVGQKDSGVSIDMIAVVP